MKTDLFQSCGRCWVFQIWWHVECNTLAAASFRIWNSSPGIPSPPLALLIVMLPKVHLTSHSSMSGSRWVITLSWLSGSWRSFLYSSVYSCHLFLISSVLLVPYHFYFYLPRETNFKYERYLLLKYVSFYPECYLFILCNFSKCIILTVLIILELQHLKWWSLATGAVSIN